MSAINILLFLKFFFFAPPSQGNVPKSIYDFKVMTLDGKFIDLSAYKGKKIMIVNTASECGYTPQYAALETIYEKYKDKMVIIGFPANNFGAQEPGTNTEIATFCKSKYNVTFPMAAKVSVVGDDMALIYQWLTNKKYNNYMSSVVKWNFQKYLFNERGELVAIFEPKLRPDAAEIIAAIEK